MNIIKKETLEFSEKESDALRFVTEMCLGINREASCPDLKELACETYDKICELWGWEE